MSDPNHPTPDDDRRDEQVASLLAVEPLDELTRRRLVDTAMRSTSRRPWARYAVAAALVLGLAVGGTALLLGSSRDHQTAARPPGRSPSAAGPSQLLPNAAASAPAPINLGDYGDLGDAGNLARLRAAVASGTGASRSQRATLDLAGEVSAARACAHTTTPVTAVATGRIRGRAALVLVSGRQLTAVLQNPCYARPLR